MHTTTDDQLAALYRQQGYIVVRGLFARTEAEQARQHYMHLRENGTYALDHQGVDSAADDPIMRYPRMTHVQRWDPDSLQLLTQSRLAYWLRRLIEQEPFLVQGMVYFKPPGSRGQALHQDQFYLKVQPGTCMAVWIALERADEDNGCLQVVRDSGGLPILCTQRADTTLSFTDVGVPVPEGMETVPLVMEPGDAVLFNGSLIHGSQPNRTADRFRCALTGHYVAAGSDKVAAYYQPALRMDGTEAGLGTSVGGGPCGVWVDRAGEPVVEMAAGGIWRAEMQGIEAGD
ncbi:MAG: phytanoyl-CoA dioxygenase family protein [Candidatus Latescibacteria bacterium]|nr:phytanoyl-CoA dioxygenase family protein [Candidatus Latescibacterota bacterium]